MSHKPEITPNEGDKRLRDCATHSTSSNIQTYTHFNTITSIQNTFPIRPNPEHIQSHGSASATQDKEVMHATPSLAVIGSPRRREAPNVHAAPKTEPMTAAITCITQIHPAGTSSVTSMAVIGETVPALAYS
ncbi:hypothetical protein N7457_004199 [Penicillium paradoxum]|uniref:uncharacterized protein n=1 Tax=Penicillium paradoxum TaxID=176176 RepID=UPI002547F32E|nr:uncharacterized protein N7457_004199 [Penicillium paradoxum]KAJ5782425.1 hypothetical protein N7457_004199 [Penicillium paradoxum]